ncbi:MAG: MFS transporter [Alphaproteobacteria bacterium]|nr:MFS transporter [Alphaproteobacteria bacterium]
MRDARARHRPDTAGALAGLETRRLAAETLAEVLAGKPFVPLDRARLADPRDRAFANRLVTTALRRHGHIETVTAALLERGLPKRAGLFGPLLAIGLAELLYIEGAAPHAAIDSSVTILKADRRGGHLAKLLNAALREAQRRADAFSRLPAETLIPATFRDNWRRQYGEAMLSRFAEALVLGAPLDLSFASEDPDLVAELGGRATLPLSARIESRDRPVAELPGYAEGRWWVQDVAASLPARLIDLPPGARVLDLCAAPGGKTAQLCARGYKVTALDNDKARLARLSDNLARLGFSAEIIVADAAAPLELSPFDAVLVDAPCSATGTFRRHPEVLVNRTAADVADRVALQRRIVANAVPLVGPGGSLVFATCSLERAEGEDQADWIAGSFPDLVPAPIRRGELNAPDQALTPGGRLRTHPGLDWPEIGAGGMDGFYVARFFRGL